MRDRPLMWGCLLVILLLVLSVCIGGDRLIPALAPSALERSGTDGQTLTVTGILYQKDLRDEYQILYLKNNSFSSQGQLFSEPRILIYDDAKMEVNIGSTLTVTGEVMLYQAPRNPGNFDQKLFYQKQDIHGALWAKKLEIVTAASKGVREAVFRFRIRWRSRLIQVMGRQKGAILAAMLLGEKTGMDGETKERYQANGIGHILAISGLHLSIIGIGLYHLLRRLSGSYRIGGTVGVLFLSLYILMIGLSVSVLRALIMFLFRVGADLTGRHYDAPTALAFAAGVVLLWRPLSLFDGGFYLSFGSVLALLIVTPLGKDLPFPALISSAGVQVMLLPILLYFFFEFPPYAVFLNLLVIPLMTEVLLLGIFGSAFSVLFLPLGALLLKLCGLIFSFYECLCRWTLALPFSRVVLGQPALWQIGVYAAILAGIVFALWHGKKEKERRSKPEKMKRLLPLGLLYLLGLFLLCVRFQSPGTLSVTMLDVGQGDGILIQSPDGGSYLVDGGSTNVKQVGKYRIEPCLKSLGIDHLDAVFLSHGDADHINGVAEMLARADVGISIGCLILPEKQFWEEGLSELAAQAIACDVPVATMEAGQTFRAGEVSFTCLWPTADTAPSGTNENSLVLALSYRDFDLLFTGDIGQAEEQSLLASLKAYRDGRNFEVLKVAHHGSKNSSDAAFLEALSPTLSLISAGQNNRYGHPHEEALKRLAEAGSQIYCTKESGALLLRTDGEKIWLREWLGSSE